MTKGNPRITIRVTPTQLKTLQAEAATQGVTVSQLMRQALQLLLLDKKIPR